MIKETRIENHADYDWINRKINGHGGFYIYNQYDPNSLARIGYTGNGTYIMISIYNIILLFRYLKRIIKVVKGSRPLK